MSYAILNIKENKSSLLSSAVLHILHITTTLVIDEEKYFEQINMNFLA